MRAGTKGVKLAPSVLRLWSAPGMRNGRSHDPQPQMRGEGGVCSLVRRQKREPVPPAPCTQGSPTELFSRLAPRRTFAFSWQDPGTDAWCRRSNPAPATAAFLAWRYLALAGGDLPCL